MEKKILESVLQVKELKPSGIFAGYGSVFNVRDRQNDIVTRGAFTRTLEEHRLNGSTPALLMHHDPTRPVGKFERILEDDHGLYVEGHLAMATPAGSEAFELLKAKALTGLSIGFLPRKRRFDPTDKVGLIEDVDLLEISLVSVPSNPAATVSSVKSIGSPREFERFLVDQGGFSRNQAKAIAAGGFRGGVGQVKELDELEQDEDIMSMLQSSIKFLNMRTDGAWREYAWGRDDY